MSKPTTLRASRTTIVLNKVKTFFSKPHNVILLLLGIVLTFTTVAPIVAPRDAPLLSRSLRSSSSFVSSSTCNSSRFNTLGLNPHVLRSSACAFNSRRITLSVNRP